MCDALVPTQESVDLVRKIGESVKTFHHQYHILYDIARLFEGPINYVEIGTFEGASACLMLQRPQTKVLTVDWGNYVTRKEVIDNLNKFNIHNNKFLYIEGNSQTAGVRAIVKEFAECIDILFIDGDHSRQGILKDFEMYEPLVSKNGYIIFDDYNDVKYNPQVNFVVNDIVQNLLGSEYAVGLKEFEIIGTFKNDLKAFCPYDIPHGNCFVIKKLVWKRV
jgi:predicted O-methyltransferase YrrM